MYLIDRAAQERRLASLVPVESSSQAIGQHLRDPQTGQEWLLYHALGRQPESGPRVLRELHPDLPLTQRLSVCFASGSRDDLVGLAWELSEMPDTWPSMLEWLEEREVLSVEQIALFLGNVTVLGAVNRRSVAGQKVGEVLAEFRRYSGLAARARHLVEGRESRRETRPGTRQDEGTSGAAQT
jgi:hypothetical protein